MDLEAFGKWLGIEKILSFHRSRREHRQAGIRFWWSRQILEKGRKRRSQSKSSRSCVFVLEVSDQSRLH